jgi:DNA polymerase/3'-5' exonuclease PolX
MGNRFSYEFAMKEYEKLSAYLEKGGFRHDVSGSLRRKKSDIGDIDVVVMGDEKIILEYIIKYPEIGHRINQYEYMLESGISIHIIAEVEAEYTYTLWHSTGPKPHVKLIENMYTDKNKQLDKMVVDEKDLYESIGLAYIIPEERYRMV